MNAIFLKLSFLLCLTSLSLVSAQDATKLVQLAETPAEKILEFEGENVRVRGYVESTRVNATGIHFLNFKGTAFECVTFARYVRSFEGGAPSELYKEKWIEVTGKIENYRGNPQIKLLEPDQVKIIDAPAPPKPVVETKTPAETEKPEQVEPGKEQPVTPAVVAKESAEPELEVIEGVPAIDWRKYFPSGKAAKK